MWIHSIDYTYLCAARISNVEFIQNMYAPAVYGRLCKYVKRGYKIELLRHSSNSEIAKLIEPHVEEQFGSLPLSEYTAFHRAFKEIQCKHKAELAALQWTSFWDERIVNRRLLTDRPPAWTL